MTTNLDSPRKIHHDKARAQKVQRDLLVLLGLGTMGVQGLILLILLFLFGSYFSLSRRPLPSMVQLIDGETMPIA